MDEQTQAVVERMGLFFERDGLPRIAGRVLGHLLLSAEPASLDDLAEALQVSKSSVSTDARMLERMGTLERVTVPGDRRDYYQVSNLSHRMAALWRERLLVMRGLMGEALATPAAEVEVVRDRLLRGAHLLEGLAAAMEEVGQGVWGEAEGRGDDPRAAGVA